MTESMQSILAQVDAQIAAQKLRPGLGDRRKGEKLLPEGLENRRKLADRRKSRLASSDKERD